jgi:malate dehydrogenase
MRDVVILGAGELGGTLTHVLARSDAATTIRLIDDAGEVAAGKALDIMQASPIERFATRVTGKNDLAAVAGAHVIVMADRAAGGEWRGGEAMLMLKRLRSAAGRGVILCAGSSHAELVERGVRELGYRREQLFGSAPEALASAVRALVAVEANGSPREVALTVLGVPPSQTVIPWNEATIGGLAAVRLLDEPARRRLAARVGPLWPPGPIALAAAAAKAIQAVFGQSRQLVCAFVAPDDSAGRRLRTAALPVRLGPDGISRVEIPSLSVHDRIVLDNAMQL